MHCSRLTYYLSVRVRGNDSLAAHLATTTDKYISLCPLDGAACKSQTNLLHKQTQNTYLHLLYWAATLLHWLT